MASVELSCRGQKAVAYSPLCEMDKRQRREFHDALLDAKPMRLGDPECNLSRAAARACTQHSCAVPLGHRHAVAIHASEQPRSRPTCRRPRYPYRLLGAVLLVPRRGSDAAITHAVSRDHFDRLDKLARQIIDAGRRLRWRRSRTCQTPCRIDY
jgi:hypothetical protein